MKLQIQSHFRARNNPFQTYFRPAWSSRVPQGPPESPRDFLSRPTDLQVDPRTFRTFGVTHGPSGPSEKPIDPHLYFEGLDTKSVA
ncbi:hypothetical protein ACRALDRAFT_211872 [Sodiomyces alcalophilus JCM 7366]|uniref:uncharacterized protein n=1 Tax=Sodiomyces alcalophilus JCM 7366 TaxID=591952 RepID=UPI0039B3FFDA